MSTATESATEPGVGSRKLFENDKVIGIVSYYLLVLGSLDLD